MPLNRVITAGGRVCRFHAHASLRGPFLVAHTCVKASYFSDRSSGRIIVVLRQIGTTGLKYYRTSNEERVLME